MRHDAITATRRYLNIALGHLPLEDAPTIAGIGAAKEAAGKAFKLLDASHKLLEAGIYTVMDEPAPLPEIPEPGPRLFKDGEPAPEAVVDEVPPEAKQFNFLLGEFLDRYWPAELCDRDPSKAEERMKADDEWTARWRETPEAAVEGLRADFDELATPPDFENTPLIEIEEAFRANVARLRRVLEAEGYDGEELEEAIASWQEGWDRDADLVMRNECFVGIFQAITVEVDSMAVTTPWIPEVQAPAEDAAPEEQAANIADLIIPGEVVDAEVTDGE